MVLDSNRIPVACLAPSFPAHFLCHPEQLVTALKLAGFAYVEETAVVLPEIQNMRDYFVKELGYPLIGESCPMVKELINNRFRDLNKHIPPIPSPMELHGRKMKAKYGPNCQAVFFSPCVYKRRENEIKKTMDHVATFTEMGEWLERKIQFPLNGLARTRFDSSISRREVRLSVLKMSIHGASACEQFLSNFPNEQTQPFSELLYCDGGCVQTARASVSYYPINSNRILETWNDYD